MSYYERDSTTGVITKAEGVPDDVIRLMERMDEDAIVHKLTTGMESDAYFYRFPIKTKAGVKEIIGISVDGADGIALMLGNVEALNDVRLDKDSDPDYIYAMVRVKDISRQVTLIGVGRQCKFVVDEGNRPVRDRMDEHAFVKAVSKGQRNGILHITPEEVIVKAITIWSARGKSKQIAAPPRLETEPIRQPPAKPTAAAPVRPPAPVAPPAPAPVVAPVQPIVNVPPGPTPVPEGEPLFAEDTPQAAAQIAPVPVAITPEQIAQQQERLKQLRVEVHNRFQIDLGIGVEKRREIIKARYGMESLTDLNEQQLMECKVLVEEMIAQRGTKPPAQPKASTSDKDEHAKNLGFDSFTEQTKLRGTLFSALTLPAQLGLNNDEAKEFVTKRGYTTTNDMPKDKLLEMVKEVNELVQTRQTPSSF